MVALPAASTPDRRSSAAYSTSRYRSHPCLVNDVRLAAGRIDTLTVRPAGDADRGPWPAWFLLVLAGAAVGVLLLGAALVSVRRRA